MSCRRAFEVDLAGFLLDPRAEEFASFRDHYPRCPECSAELGVWTQLEQQLSTPAEAHPDPVALDRYERGADLSESERRRLESHLSSCASCRDELQALRAFHPSQQAPEARAARRSRAQSDEQAPEARAARRSRAQSDRWVSLLDKLRRLTWSPGFAYALLALVLGPAIYVTLDSMRVGQDLATGGALDEVEALRRPALPGRVEPMAAPPAAEDKERAFARDVPAQAVRKGQVAEKQELEVRRDLQAARMRAAAKPEALAMEESLDVTRAAPGATSAMAFSRGPGAVHLRAGTPVTVAAAAALRGFQLVAPLPPGLASENAEVRLAQATGRRELRERSGASGAGEVGLLVPAGWLEPGLYRVAIHDVRADASDVPLSVFRLRVAR